VRQQILKVLKKQNGSFLSGHLLAEQLAISRVAVWKHIEALRDEGYQIEAVKGVGYRLRPGSDVIIPEEVGRALQGTEWGREVYYYAELGSTNEEIKATLSQRTLAEGTVIIAGKQLQGKGRLGRTWVSPAGGLWFSILLKPGLDLAQTALLSLVFSLAVCQGVKNMCQVPAFIKWPNDVVLQGRKLSGILLELSGEIDHTRQVIVGIGINVNNRSEDYAGNQAISLAEYTGQSIDLTSCLISVLKSMNSAYQQFLQQGFTDLRRQYIQHCCHLNKQVEIMQGGERLGGLNVDIDEMGHLVLLGNAGTIRLSTGDVRVLE
jgi:BirA family biotin operon repressor/biotin-[acetyl-CoA-carboxylase] ligase